MESQPQNPELRNNLDLFVCLIPVNYLSAMSGRVFLG